MDDMIYWLILKDPHDLGNFDYVLILRRVKSEYVHHLSQHR